MMHQKEFTSNLPLLPLLLFLCSFVSLHDACNQNDQNSLLAFFQKLSSSSHPLNWSSSTNCCFWDGIRCNDNDQVTHLSLPQRGLTGNVSPFLGNLTNLSYLNLSRNRLFGQLPPEFFSLGFLETIDLSYNHLSGSLSQPLPFKFVKTIDLSSNSFNGKLMSSSFQLTRNLVRFNISDNTFTGLIPSSICINASHSLQFIDFSHNDFQGEVPLGLGKCSELQALRAGFNSLTGFIPGDILNSTNLQELYLPANHFSGPISNGINQLRDLQILDLSRNSLNGLIPESIGELSELETLLLYSNNLSGPLPPSLMNCTQLINLNLRLNYLVGDFSEFNFSRLSHLQSIDLGNNNFTGIIPPSLFSCKSLASLRLTDNNLYGQFSADFASLQSLTYLSIAKNKLTNITGALKVLSACKNLTTLLLCGNFQYEMLPDEESITQSDQFKNLQIVSLCQSNLTGQIPVWLANLKKLKLIEMSTNLLTGPIPSWLWSLPSLFYVNLSENLLSGEFPKGLCMLPALESRDTSMELPIFLNLTTTLQQYNALSSIPALILLARNNLTGNIPTEIGQLKFLQILDLSHNNFSGRIPEQISQLTNLETLDLSANNLSGEIPPSFTSLHFLSKFSIADNDLRGKIPLGGQFETFPRSSFEGNPRLCGPILQHSCSNQAPEATKSESKNEATDQELYFGLVGGVTFGFLIGSIIGFLFSIRKLKLLVQRCYKNEKGNNAVHNDQQLQRLHQTSVLFRHNLEGGQHDTSEQVRALVHQSNKKQPI